MIEIESRLYFICLNNCCSFCDIFINNSKMQSNAFLLLCLLYNKFGAQRGAREAK